MKRKPADETIKMITVRTEKELVPYFESLQKTLQDISADWNVRINSLRQLQGLLIGGSHNVPGFKQKIEDLIPALVAQADDLRSAVQKEACKCIEVASEEMGDKFETAAIWLLEWDGLLHLLGNGKKILADCGHECIEKIISRVPSVQYFQLLSEQLGSKNQNVRVKVSSYFVQMLREYPIEIINKVQQIVEEVILKTCKDANQEVRTLSRSAYCLFEEIYPQRALQLYECFDQPTRKLLQSEKEKFSSNTTNGSRRRALSSAKIQKKDNNSGKGARTQSAAPNDSEEEKLNERQTATDLKASKGGNQRIGGGIPKSDQQFRNDTRKLSKIDDDNKAKDRNLSQISCGSETKEQSQDQIKVKDFIQDIQQNILENQTHQLNSIEQNAGTNYSETIDLKNKQLNCDDKIININSSSKKLDLTTNQINKSQNQQYCDAIDKRNQNTINSLNNTLLMLQSTSLNFKNNVLANESSPISQNENKNLENLQNKNQDSIFKKFQDDDLLLAQGEVEIDEVINDNYNNNHHSNNNNQQLTEDNLKEPSSGMKRNIPPLKLPSIEPNFQNQILLSSKIDTFDGRAIHHENYMLLDELNEHSLENPKFQSQIFLDCSTSQLQNEIRMLTQDQSSTNFFDEVVQKQKFSNVSLNKSPRFDLSHHRLEEQSKILQNQQQQLEEQRMQLEQQQVQIQILLEDKQKRYSMHSHSSNLGEKQPSASTNKQVDYATLENQIQQINENNRLVDEHPRLNNSNTNKSPVMKENNTDDKSGMKDNKLTPKQQQQQQQQQFFWQQQQQQEQQQQQGIINLSENKSGDESTKSKQFKQNIDSHQNKKLQADQLKHSYHSPNETPKNSPLQLFSNIISQEPQNEFKLIEDPYDHPEQSAACSFTSSQMNISRQQLPFNHKKVSIEGDEDIVIQQKQDTINSCNSNSNRNNKINQGNMQTFNSNFNFEEVMQIKQQSCPQQNIFTPRNEKQQLQLEAGKPISLEEYFIRKNNFNENDNGSFKQQKSSQNMIIQNGYQFTPQSSQRTLKGEERTIQDVFSPTPQNSQRNQKGQDLKIIQDVSASTPQHSQRQQKGQEERTIYDGYQLTPHNSQRKDEVLENEEERNFIQKENLVKQNSLNSVFTQQMYENKNNFIGISPTRLAFKKESSQVKINNQLTNSSPHSNNQAAESPIQKEMSNKTQEKNQITIPKLELKSSSKDDQFSSPIKLKGEQSNFKQQQYHNTPKKQVDQQLRLQQKLQGQSDSVFQLSSNASNLISFTVSNLEYPHQPSNKSYNSQFPSDTKDNSPNHPLFQDLSPSPKQKSSKNKKISLHNNIISSLTSNLNPHLNNTPLVLAFENNQISLPSDHKSLLQETHQPIICQSLISSSGTNVQRESAQFYNPFNNEYSTEDQQLNLQNYQQQGVSPLSLLEKGQLSQNQPLVFAPTNQPSIFSEQVPVLESFQPTQLIPQLEIQNEDANNVLENNKYNSFSVQQVVYSPSSKQFQPHHNSNSHSQAQINIPQYSSAIPPSGNKSQRIRSNVSSGQFQIACFPLENKGSSSYKEQNESSSGFADYQKNMQETKDFYEKKVLVSLERMQKDIQSSLQKQNKLLKEHTFSYSAKLKGEILDTFEGSPEKINASKRHGLSENKISRERQQDAFAKIKNFTPILKSPSKQSYIKQSPQRSFLNYSPILNSSPEKDLTKVVCLLSVNTSDRLQSIEETIKILSYFLDTNQSLYTKVGQPTLKHLAFQIDEILRKENNLDIQRETLKLLALFISLSPNTYLTHINSSLPLILDWKVKTRHQLHHDSSKVFEQIVSRYHFAQLLPTLLEIFGEEEQNENIRIESLSQLAIGIENEAQINEVAILSVFDSIIRVIVTSKEDSQLAVFGLRTIEHILNNNNQYFFFQCKNQLSKEDQVKLRFLSCIHSPSLEGKMREEIKQKKPITHLLESQCQIKKNESNLNMISTTHSIYPQHKQAVNDDLHISQQQKVINRKETIQEINSLKALEEQLLDSSFQGRQLVSKQINTIVYQLAQFLERGYSEQEKMIALKLLQNLFARQQCFPDLNKASIQKMLSLFSLFSPYSQDFITFEEIIKDMECVLVEPSLLAAAILEQMNKSNKIIEFLLKKLNTCISNSQNNSFFSENLESACIILQKIMTKNEVTNATKASIKCISSLHSLNPSAIKPYWPLFSVDQQKQIAIKIKASHKKE